jgi:hypothetical protein
MKEIIRPFARPRTADAPAEPDYSQPGALEETATRAGLIPEQAFDTSWAFTCPDEDTLKRALVAPMGIAALVGEPRARGQAGDRRGTRQAPDLGRDLPAPQRVPLPDRT